MRKAIGGSPVEQNVTLLTLTKKLLDYMEFISNKYDEVKISGVRGDFFTEVKPFADEVKEINDKWSELASSWIASNRPKNLHVKQIESSTEQIEMLSVQAFYPETSKTRFINYVQSVRFILTTLIVQLEKQ
ncbi:DUF1798 family protein [Robertmurraya yapensis]|uniref:DUF1798 family protein n=1 Tax=Bacillus yapensis TaxID=2492960 RepID=A0A3S0KN33_9BACI|nr:DUF1798 family protein [Bacillus yapensis]TKS95353.1 DUF1798 family protein [Bacillus yapensis]